MSAPLFAVRSAARFSCLVERCEDTCCAGLQVPVEPAAVERLSALLGGAERLQPYLRLEGGALRLAHQGGACGFLEAGRCGLQRRFGEPALPDVCSSFPRSVTVRRDQRRVTLSLACPEAARLCLLSSDGAVLEEVPESSLPRARPSAPGEGGDSAWEALAGRLFETPAPLGAQLVTLAELSLRGDPSGEVERVFAVAGGLHRFHLPWPKAMSLLLSLVEARGPHPSQPRWTALTSELREALPPDDAEEAWRRYLERRDAQEAAHGPRIAGAFQNYARYQWARFPVGDCPTPLAWACRLSVRAALVRMLLALTAPRGAGPAELDAALVRAFQLSAKHLEAHPAVREQVDAVLDCPAPELLVKTLLFATFI